MNRSIEEIQRILATFQAPEMQQYPELAGYSRNDCYEDFFGGGGLYLASRMGRTLHLKPGERVLDLGCGKGSASVFLVRQYGAQVTALDLWTTAEFLNEKFSRLGCRDHIQPIRMDATDPLPFENGYFDAIFCMNSFSFYGGSLDYIRHVSRYLKSGGRLSIGSEALSVEFTPEQMANPPFVYSFKLPPPNEAVDVFEGDFKKQHTLAWWRDLFEKSGVWQVEVGQELEDAEIIYEELVRYEHEKNLDPFDVQICLDQIEWGRAHSPYKTLYVLTAKKL